VDEERNLPAIFDGTKAEADGVIFDFVAHI